MFFVWSVVFLVSFSKQNIFTTVTNRYEASKHIPNNQTAQNKQKYSIFPDLAQDRIYIRKPCDQKKTCLYYPTKIFPYTKNTKPNDILK